MADLPEPFYRNPVTTIYLGDSSEIIPLFSDKFDLLVTDPPYGVEFQSNIGKNFDKITGDREDKKDHITSIVSQAIRSLRNHRHAYVFGPKHLIEEEKLAKPIELIWNKDHLGMGNLQLPWGPSFEPITFGVYVPSKANREGGDGALAAKMRQGSVLTVKRKNSRGVNRHPTEKPVELLARLIESSSLRGEAVFDPFLGSGSTAVAAILTGRKCVGIEIDENYAEIAAERAEIAHKKTLSLWKEVA